MQKHYNHFLLRWKNTLRRKIEDKAKVENRSLNSMINILLERAVEA